MSNQHSPYWEDPHAVAPQRECQRILHTEEDGESVLDNAGRTSLAVAIEALASMGGVGMAMAREVQKGGITAVEVMLDTAEDLERIVNSEGEAAIYGLPANIQGQSMANWREAIWLASRTHRRLRPSGSRLRPMASV